MKTPLANVASSLQPSLLAFPCVKWRSLIAFSAALLVVHTAIADPGQWTLTGSLHAGRSDHTATLLPSGKVLVVGGSGSLTATAELYDPSRGIWSATGALNTSRTLHSATLLPNGMVLVAGGFHGLDAIRSAELYDPLTGSWSFTGNLNIERQEHSAILLPDGKVLIAGGVNHFDSVHNAEIYDPATGIWTTSGSFVQQHDPGEEPVPLTLLPNGTVLVEGGLGLHIETSDVAELYDPTGGTWRRTGSLITGREGHTATLLPNGKVLVASGLNRKIGELSSAELYDPTTETWSPTGNLILAREQHTATLLANGMVLVVAGYISGGEGDIAEAELYDPASGTWSVTGSLNAARRGHTETLLPNGMALVAGGGNFGALASAELYDPGIVTPTSIKGSGFINGQGDQASFGVRATLTGGQARGSFSFSDPAAGLTITDASIRVLSINGNTARFNGRANLGGGNYVIFNVGVADNGPGTSDTLSITVSTGYSAGGTLIDGNIRIY